MTLISRCLSSLSYQYRISLAINSCARHVHAKFIVCIVCTFPITSLTWLVWLLIKITFLQKWAASVLMTDNWATSLRIVREKTLPQLSVPTFLVLIVEILNYESGKSGRAAPCRVKVLRKLWKSERCESSEHAVSGTSSRKIWDPFANKLLPMVL